MTTDPSTFQGKDVHVNGAVTIPTVITATGDVEGKIGDQILAPLQAYLAQVSTQAYALSGHGEDYMPADQAGYDSNGNPIGFPPVPVLPSHLK